MRFVTRPKPLTAYYYPGHRIHFNAALIVHNFHSLGSIPCLKLPHVMMALAKDTINLWRIKQSIREALNNV